MGGLQRRSRCLAAFAFFCVLRAGSVQATEDWITDEDIEVAAAAKAAVVDYCQEGFQGEIDAEASRKILDDGVGGGNKMLDILRGAESNSELATKAAEEITWDWLFFKVGALVMSVLLLSLWFFCCWSCCPCCKCCRCGARQRETSMLIKIAMLVAGGALTFGIIFSASYAMAGYNSAVDGFNNMACTSAKLLNGTLSGRTGPYFLGMMPILEIFQELEQQLDSNSEMMDQTRGLLDYTLPVTESVTITTETIALLKDAIGANFPSEVAENKHSCQFCTGLTPVLNEVVDVLDSSITTALSAARVEVEKQLSAENAEKLQQTFQTAAEPLIEVKVLFRDTFGSFTDTDKFLQFNGYLTGDGQTPYVKIITAIIIVIALALSCCMNVGFLSFVFFEKGKAVAGEPKPFRKIPHRCACLTWCCGWWFAILAFFVAGLMTAIAVPLSGMCIIMDDLSPQLLQDIAPALDFNTSSDEGAQALGIIENCLVPPDPTLNAMLLDLIWMRNETTDEKETLREIIVDQVKDQIQAVFAAVDDVAGQNVTLANDSKVILLREMFRNPVDMLIMTGQSDIQDFASSPDYGAMFSQTSLQEKAVSSVRCATDTMSGGFGNLTVSGVEAFVSALATFGTRNVLRTDCADTVVCADVVNSPRREACEAGNRFVTLKQNIMDLQNFRCDVFVDPQDMSSDCDPLSMTGTFNSTSGITTWTGGCLMPDGTMVRKVKPCSLSDFTAYLQAFDARLGAVVGRMDKAANEVGPAIRDGLHDIVNDKLLVPIETVGDGVTCGFLARFYREMVEGMCYQGVSGFTLISQSYTGCAVLTLFIVILSYILWRRAIDNVNSVVRTDITIMGSEGVVPTAPKDIP
mmetsp:Transcript_133644/g.337599  ORF Transcript_133644/g.337599 Transcript_133644/m.337599 type:complete len:861 (-) Transcript_133644:129-2711(-)